jgi:hypothetical protein
MSTNQKANKEKKTEEKKEVAALKPAPLLQPTLDFKHRMMLEGKKDRVDGLESINVKFFAHGMQEVTYVVRNEDDHTTELTTTAFLSFLAKKNKESKSEHEVTASKGYYAKVLKRTLVNIGEDSVEKVRAVMAGPIPKAAANILAKTQEECKLAKLNEQRGILAHWAKMPQHVYDEMDKWQFGVNPSLNLSWSENLHALFQHEKEEEERKAHKKLAKELGKTTSAGIGSQSELEKALDATNGTAGEGTSLTPPTESILKSGVKWQDDEEEKKKTAAELANTSVAKTAAKD